MLTIARGLMQNPTLLLLDEITEGLAPIVVNELGEIIEIQGTGEGRAFSLQEQQALVELCAKGNRELIRKQKELLGDILR